MKAKKSKNSLVLAVYFGIAVGIIILISLVFKGIDLFRDSKFDSNHRLSVAIVGSNATQVISVSPKDGSLLRVDINGKKSVSGLKDMSVPIDAYIEVDKNYDIENINPKSEFSKILFRLGKIKTDLSFIDLLRLSIFSGGVNSDMVSEEQVSAGDADKINDISSNLFKDPQISSEKINIQITNSTDISGLGNKLAKYITNLGGIVTLVNSSHDSVEKSKIVAEEKTETVKRLSKLLGIPFEKGQGSALGDVIIVLGQDKTDLFK